MPLIKTSALHYVWRFEWPNTSKINITIPVISKEEMDKPCNKSYTLQQSNNSHNFVFLFNLLISQFPSK